MISRRRWLGTTLTLMSAGLAFPARAEREVVERSIGAADAKVQIIEYASLTCPHCAMFHKEILPKIKTNYVDTGKVRLTFRDFPLDQVALKAAVIAHCSGGDRYFRFLDALFSSQDTWRRAKDPIGSIKQLARVGGLPEAEIDACLADPKMEEAVLKMSLEGQQKFNVSSTPTFVINGKSHSGVRDYDDFAGRIEPLLR